MMRGDDFTEAELERIDLERRLKPYDLKPGDEVCVDLLVTVLPNPEDPTHGPCRIVGKVTGATASALILNREGEGPGDGTYRIPWRAVAMIFTPHVPTAVHPALGE